MLSENDSKSCPIVYQMTFLHLGHIIPLMLKKVNSPKMFLNLKVYICMDHVYMVHGSLKCKLQKWGVRVVLVHVVLTI